jgi:hypothetical protein
MGWQLVREIESSAIDEVYASKESVQKLIALVDFEFQ